MATLRQLLTEAVPDLKPHSTTPFLDALLLASLAMGVPKERALADLPVELPGDIEHEFRRLLVQRASGTPAAYIRGVQEFYGYEFTVTPAVLIPRPETELLVERTLQLPGKRVLDLCCGSGCVGISVKLQQPWREVTCSDISPEALAVARDNACRLKAVVTVLESDLFNSIPGTFDIILTNPPYLTAEEMQCSRLISRGEPALALSAGEDGLEYIKRLIPKGFSQLAPDGYLMIENSDGQCEAVAELMAAAGFSEIEIIPDLAGLRRVVTGRRLEI